MPDDSLAILKDAHKAMLDTGFMGDGTARRYRDAFYAKVGRHFPAVLDELAALRAIVSRAREMAAKIGEAEKRENEARDLMHDGGPMMPWEEKGPLIKRCGQACNEAREARRELLAMFAEGK